MIKIEMYYIKGSGRFEGEESIFVRDSEEKSDWLLQSSKSKSGADRSRWSFGHTAGISQNIIPKHRRIILNNMDL